MFKFEEFPEIMKAHKISKKYNARINAEELKFERKITKDKSEWGKAIQQGMDFDLNEYSKVVFQQFNTIKPKLTLKKTSEIVSWEIVFENKNFEELSEKQRKTLMMMVECERPYRLPDEYYNNKDWFEEVKKKSSKVK